jgi:protein-tyrosine-phosphatase
MIIHFICRGNSFRSIIAEAYLNSLGIKESSVISSGTIAALDKEKNFTHYRMTLDLLDAHGIRDFAKDGYGDQLTQSRVEKGDLTVCMNHRVYDECLRQVSFPERPHIWSVADVGEPGRIAHNEAENLRYREEAYQEITANVDRLILELSGKNLCGWRAGSTRCGAPRRACRQVSECLPCAL